MIHYTSIEQVKHLLGLGLSPESADMEYLFLKETNSLMNSIPFVKDKTEVENSALRALCYRIPCWSLAALLDVMPKIPRVEFNLVLPGVSDEPPYIAFDDCRENHQVHLNFEGRTPLEAAYNTVCWLLENGYIKKEAKVMKAPDKLYLSELIYSSFQYAIPDPDESQVEYINKKVFLIRISEWLSLHSKSLIMEDSSQEQVVSLSDFTQFLETLI